LLAFESRDPDTDLSCGDHVHVISAIADCQSGLLRVPAAHHENDFSFLLGAHTAGKDDVGALTKIHKLLHHRFIILNCRQCLTSDYHSVVSGLFSQVLVAKSFDDFDSDLFGFDLLQHEHVHLVVQELA